MRIPVLWKEKHRWVFISKNNPRHLTLTCWGVRYCLLGQRHTSEFQTALVTSWKMSNDFRGNLGISHPCQHTHVQSVVDGERLHCNVPHFLHTSTPPHSPWEPGLTWQIKTQSLYARQRYVCLWKPWQVRGEVETTLISWSKIQITLF